MARPGPICKRGGEVGDRAVVFALALIAVAAVVSHARFARGPHLSLGKDEVQPVYAPVTHPPRFGCAILPSLVGAKPGSAISEPMTKTASPWHQQGRTSMITPDKYRTLPNIAPRRKCTMKAAQRLPLLHRDAPGIGLNPGLVLRFP